MLWKFPRRQLEARVGGVCPGRRFLPRKMRAIFFNFSSSFFFLRFLLFFLRNLSDLYFFFFYALFPVVLFVQGCLCLNRAFFFHELNWKLKVNLAFDLVGINRHVIHTHTIYIVCIYIVRVRACVCVNAMLTHHHRSRSNARLTFNFLSIFNGRQSESWFSQESLPSLSRAVIRIRSLYLVFSFCKWY